MIPATLVVASVAVVVLMPTVRAQAPHSPGVGRTPGLCPVVSFKHS
jgi:hypothetical protein